jgi:hypothetical protein
MVTPDKILSRNQVCKEVLRNGKPHKQHFWVKSESAKRNGLRQLPTSASLVEEALNIRRNQNER